jgi:hypothetical protein
MTYNGYKDWDHWNVSLWINNDETIYGAAYIMVSSMGAKKAAGVLSKTLAGTKTPDGAKYTYNNIYSTLLDMEV